MARLRLIKWRVRVAVMADDDENLASISIESHLIRAAERQLSKYGGDEQGLMQLRKQVEQTVRRQAANSPATALPGRWNGDI